MANPIPLLEPVTTAVFPSNGVTYPVDRTMRCDCSDTRCGENGTRVVQGPIELRAPSPESPSDGRSDDAIGPSARTPA